MKKFKLLALAVMAMLGTNAMAADPESATKLFTFSYSGTNATITGFVSELEDEFKTAVAIPEQVTDAVNKDAEGKYLKYNVIGIAPNAFKDQPVSTITFFAKAYEGGTLKKGITTIGAGAFAGTNITSLDLSNTAISTVENLFGTAIGWNASEHKTTDADKVNTKIATVKLPDTWTSIADNAFANCTALATVDFGTPRAGLGSQTISAGAFAGCPLTALDLSKTKVTSLTANTLFDTQYTYTGGVVTMTTEGKFKASTVKTVTVNKSFTNFNNNLTGDESLTTVTGFAPDKDNKKNIGDAEFNGCKALATISTKFIEQFGAYAFANCAALTSIDLTSVTATGIGAGAFSTSGLTSVTFPATVLTTIPDKAFWQCTNLATATLSVKNKNSAVNSIGADAFGYTGLTTFTIPETTVAMTIGSKAFAGTPLTDFTWAPDAAYNSSTLSIAMDAFSRCSNVAFHTTQKFAEGTTSTDGWYNVTTVKKPNGPTNTIFDYNTNPAETKFTTTAYKSNSSKYYVKWYNASKDIAVKKGDAKVYAGFMEADGTLSMIQFKADGDGYYQIKANDVALIITDNADLSYIGGNPTTAYGTSWLQTIAAPYTTGEITTDGANALKYVTAATTRATLESQTADESYYIYGWVNTASACGFQKITTGTTIPEGTLFAFAKEPAAGGRLNVKWYDENGNLESETTAIESIEAAQAEAAEIYNLQGVRVSGAKKGLYIKNGKKFIVK